MVCIYFTNTVGDNIIIDISIKYYKPMNNNNEMIQIDQYIRP